MIEGWCQAIPSVCPDCFSAAVLHVCFGFFCRAPEPQKPHTKPLEDLVRSNHYDPDEDEEYYRKQLSYFDRRSFDSKAMGQPPPGINRFHDLPKPAQLSYPYNRYENTPDLSTVG